MSEVMGNKALAKLVAFLTDFVGGAAKGLGMGGSGKPGRLNPTFKDLLRQIAFG